MKVNRSAATAIFAGSAIMALGLTGCSAGGGVGQSSTSATLTVWVDANRVEEMQDIAAKFEDDKGIKVELVQKEYGDVMRNDFIQQVPAGEGPDVMVGGNDWLGQLVQNGVVAPLELGDTAADFSDVAIGAMTYDEVTYGLPVSLENIALLRNTALASSTPATWDELIAAGQAVVASGAAQYPVLVPSDPVDSDPYHLYPLQTSYGAPLFAFDADNGYDTSELLVGSEGGNAFAAKLVEWGAAGIINTSITGDIARDEFAAGKSPFMLSGPWNLPAFQEGGIDYAIEAIPQAGPDAPTPFVGVQGFFVSSQSKNAIAANEFVVNYLGSEEAQLALYEAGGRPPALNSAFEIASAENPDVGAFGEVGRTGVPMPSIPEMGAVWDNLGATQSALLNGTAGDPTEAWQAMTERLREVVGG